MSALTLYEQGYGSFVIGNMRLALPMKYLREVVPWNKLSELPSPAAWVAGGFCLRGVIIPVIDLECLLGKRTKPQQEECIVLVAHEGQLIGIAATRVQSVFFTDPKHINSVQSKDPISQILAGSLKSPDEDTVFNVLSMQALFDLPELPAIKDPEPHRQLLDNSMQEDAMDDTELALSLMLVQSNGILFAIHPRDIETTITNLTLIPSNIHGDYYQGDVQYRGHTIPAVNLAMYLGLGQHQKANFSQAFVIRFPQGPIAFLLDRVIDIVRVGHADVIALPKAGLKKPEALEGLMSASAITPLRPGHENGHQYFVLSSAGLQADKALQDLASVIAQTNSEHDTQQLNERSKQSGLKNLVIFNLEQEFCTPLDDVAEVLPYNSHIEIFERANPMLGILNHRGQAVPIFDLSQWLGNNRQQLNNESSVLLIEHDGNLLGFAVQSLCSIEFAHWAPNVPVLGEQRTIHQGIVKESQILAEIGTGERRRMLELIDLKVQAHLINHKEQQSMPCVVDQEPNGFTVAN